MSTKSLDVFFNNSHKIMKYFLERVLITGLGNCLLRPHTINTILNYLWSFGRSTFTYVGDICVKQKEGVSKKLWIYEPKLKIILDLLKEFNLVKQEGNMYYLCKKKIKLSLPKRLIYLSKFYPSFWNFSILLTSRLWILNLFEFPCKPSQEVLSQFYKALFFREQVNKSLELIIKVFSPSIHNLKLYFLPSDLSVFYYNNENLHVTVSSTLDEADFVVVNNFLNVYSLLELRIILKNRNFILIQPVKSDPLSAISILYSKKSLPENIMLKVDYSPTPITFVKYS
ncbi:MAG: hypothetical protein J7L47_00130 [Candidatus Odinarchaeota archaeon]|nr:hypothetical protein [Candidatus Odinarchaeota archaeon]